MVTPKTLLSFMHLFIVSNRSDTWYFANNNNRHFSFSADERFLPVHQFAAEDNKKITHLDGFAEAFLLNLGSPERIDDAGLRGAGGMLRTSLGVPFCTPPGDLPNCTFVSCFDPDRSFTSVILTGRAEGVYLLVAGSTLPQCSRMQNALLTVEYADGNSAKLPLCNPENWWLVEQDYLIDGYLFVNKAPLPPRVDLRSGQPALSILCSSKAKE